MKKETAIRLRDVGFPQNYPRLCGCNGERTCGLHHEIGSPAYEPDLQELADELGDKFETIGRTIKGGWFAAGDDATLYGDSPEDALAELYLATKL